ncbi:class I SAM-dependent methyltransferase [Aurantimonas marianensis]|uniref:Class I SAM-dependent methyltransferase n=1 Tax=Aurantimonas marianensis TaxID=2920428 RepID=A0A9X2H4H3_9HYPH|nr:class I SAM-dependent methyltransferase [Aurantimonas marianensis]MCP3053600.1 class I SAM-dependent methyltransferase [Aurantimonas marianensis]
MTRKTAASSATGSTRPAAGFWDRNAARYARRPIADEATYRTKLRITRDYLQPDMEVLELGCGTGSTAIAHAPYVSHIRATDISPNMIAIARERAKEGGVANVSFECAAIEDIAAPEESFDAILALNLLHLVEDRDGVIARVAALLKPGGAFVTSTACLADGMKWFKLVAPIGRLFGVFPLVRVFGKADLEASLKRHGFTIAHDWQPTKNPVVFLVAVKASGAT